MTQPLPEPVGLDGVLGFSITRAEPDEVLGTFTIGPQHHQPYGIVHGGVYCSVIEAAASVGAALWLADRGKVVGTTNTTHFVRAVREGVLAVKAEPLQRGRTQQLWTVTITDEQGRLVAKGDVRLANLPATAV